MQLHARPCRLLALQFPRDYRGPCSTVTGYAMQGDIAKRRAAYQDFLTLWKDADPDSPILVAAKAEYAKLK
jgi:hypothetical protein